MNTRGPAPSRSPAHQGLDPVLAFVDVQAGTPFPRVLRRLYPDDSLAVRSGAPGEIAEQIDSGVGMIRGPFVFGIHEHLSRPVNYVTILRDPVQHVVASYEHVRRQPKHHLHRMVVEEEIGIEEFVRSEIAAIDTRNPQTRRILGRRVGEPTQAWLEEAKVYLADHFKVAGLDDDFAGFLTLCQVELGWDQEALHPLSHVVRTRSPALDVSAAAAELIGEHTALDGELYHFGREVFSRRRDRVPEFRARVEVLTTASGTSTTEARREAGSDAPRGRLARRLRRWRRRLVKGSVRFRQSR